MSDDVETEQLIPDQLSLTDAITVTVGTDIDFSGRTTVSTTQAHVGGHSEMMDVEMADEVVIKTEIDDSGKPVLPPIPFSFPGQTFDTKCQKLILNVWDFFKRVKKNPDILDEIRTPQERAAAALHISAATIGKIGKNLKKTGKLETPGKKRKRTRPIVDSVSPADEEIIRQIIMEFRENKQNPPTLPIVLAEARNRLNFTGGATSFRRILQRMGFKNLSQKNVIIKAKVTPISQDTTTTVQSISTLPMVKVIKKENTGTVQQIQQKVVPNLINISSSNATTTTLANLAQSGSSGITLTSAGNIHQGGNVFHIGGGGLQLTQENAQALANAVQLTGASGGTQTLHILGPDNTLRPIQVVYATSSMQ